MCEAPTQGVNKWISNDHLALTETLSLRRAEHTGAVMLAAAACAKLPHAAHVFALCKRVTDGPRVVPQGRGNLGQSVSHIAKGRAGVHVRAGMWVCAPASIERSRLVADSMSTVAQKAASCAQQRSSAAAARPSDAGPSRRCVSLPTLPCADSSPSASCPPSAVYCEQQDGVDSASACSARRLR